MVIGVVKESRAGERRVAATPATVVQLLKLGYDVVVEPGAGVASRFPDEAYVEAGANMDSASLSASGAPACRSSSDQETPAAPQTPPSELTRWYPKAPSKVSRTRTPPARRAR